MWIFIIISLIPILWIYFSRKPKNHTFGIFHPYSNGGGGGEMVLWCIIRSIQQSHPESDIILYTGDVMPENEMAEKISKVFGIELLRKIRLVPLKTRFLLEARLYPRFTLILQSLGSMIVGLEAIWRCCPHIYFDSMGYAFTYVIPKMLGCQVMCYTHYPTISTDMLERVSSRTSSHNNNNDISTSTWKTSAKLLYYRLFAYIYGIIGHYLTDKVCVNSSWTMGHISTLWGRKVNLLFPPCSVSDFCKFRLENRKPIILSIGQFRPEKDHTLQIESFELMQARYPKWVGVAKLVLLGGCRDVDDERRVSELKSLSKSKDVEFVVNATLKEKENLLKSALIGLHTMWNEHFGICIVEYQASGLIPLAHKSGGPLVDIVVDVDGKTTGYLADNKEDYAETMNKILEKYKGVPLEEQILSRQISSRFSQEVFEKQLISILKQK